MPVLTIRPLHLAAAGALLLAAAPLLADQPQAGAAGAQQEVDQRGRWVTLGTRAGPVASPVRSQPANLLIAGDARILVDVGDGTMGRLAALGILPPRVDAVFISHLHWDHTGGLAALLGLRAQNNSQVPLAIYGPPGTAEMVEGLLASMKPGAASGYGVAGAATIDLSKLTSVTELRDGASLTYRGVKVLARNNTHYSFAPESGLAGRFESLSFRFDLPGRSIVYTGDTGPSSAVEKLAAGADLLVAEMMDVDDTIARTLRFNPNMPEPRRLEMEKHLREHHLLPADVGQMAARAKVKAVVVTHFAGRERDDPAHFGYLRQIAAQYAGPVVIANDLDVF